MAELIVVTGGSFSGKTSLVGALAALGHEVLGESAMEVIDELVRAHGLDGQVAWRSANQVEFQRRITLRQHERERAARASPARYVFCDRGLLDGMAYCRLAGADWPPDLHDLVASTRYAHVFVLETLTIFEPRAETGRSDSRDESIRVAALLEGIYRPCASRLTRLPVAPIAERAGAVLRTLGLQTPPA